MATWSHSAFLQALGWATLNSFWQMALLWCVFEVATALFRLSSSLKYKLAIGAIFSGFAWFINTLLSFWLHQAPIQVTITTVTVSQPLLDAVVMASSITYLLLLLIPAYRLMQNWQHIIQLRNNELQKAPLNSRLFVKKIAYQLGIKRPVQVYLSQLIQSPLTIGYIKPVILLPVAMLNHLTTQQVEAILLHELSHIKRYDYLINMGIMIIHTLLYFNPFVKLLMRLANAERENCCDELVIQYQYDKISYAAALLALEKNAQSLLMTAARKNHLLTRIEIILGVDKKPVFRMAQIIGVFAVFLLVCLINAVMIVGNEEQTTNTDLAFTQLANPFYFINPEHAIQDEELPLHQVKMTAQIAEKDKKERESYVTPAYESSTAPETLPLSPLPGEGIQLIPVDYKLENAALNNEQKRQVQKTVKATKKILSTLEWQAVENEIADGMTNSEKSIAKKQYLAEIEKINWKRLENNLKSEYERMNWQAIDQKIQSAMLSIQLDSLKSVYNEMKIQAIKTRIDSAKCTLAYPDVTIEQIEKVQQEAQKRIERIEAIKTKPVVRL